MKHVSAIFFALLFMTTLASAHAMLDRADPKVGSTAAKPPRQVTLWFTQDLEPKFSRIEVRNDKGERVDTGKPQVSRTQMRVSVKALPPGSYKVNWSVLSVDTHHTQGDFSFRVGQ